MLVMKDKLWGLLIVDLFLYLLVRKGGLSKKSSNEVRMEFSVKNKTLAMTSKMHLALFSLAKTFLQSYQRNWRNLSARILLESDFF